VVVQGWFIHDSRIYYVRQQSATHFITFPKFQNTQSKLFINLLTLMQHLLH
ncbi:MAG: hypothetical protein RLZZ107_1970, partial [Bacteroidota bacterium]